MLLSCLPRGTFSTCFRSCKVGLALATLISLKVMSKTSQGLNKVYTPPSLWGLVRSPPVTQTIAGCLHKGLGQENLLENPGILFWNHVSEWGGWGGGHTQPHHRTPARIYPKKIHSPWSMQTEKPQGWGGVSSLQICDKRGVLHFLWGPAWVINFI